MEKFAENIGRAWEHYLIHTDIIPE